MSALLVALLSVTPAADPTLTREDVLQNTIVGGAVGGAIPIAARIVRRLSHLDGETQLGSSALACAALSYGCTSSGGVAIGALRPARVSRKREAFGSRP